MANAISLLEYLQWAPPALPIGAIGTSRENTTNTNYSPADINEVGRWADFNLNNIMAEFRPFLIEAMIDREVMPTPPREVRNEEQVRTQFKCYLDGRVRHALRVSFPELIKRNQLGNRVIISFDEGTRAKIPDQFIPDTAYFEPRLPEPTRSNRAPGDIKTSWKWKHTLGSSSNRKDRTEFKKVLAQVNYYMRQHKTRYGFILTNVELVAIRRRDSNGNLELSEPIPWTTRGDTTQPQLTVLLGLWYLGMLASDNMGWELA
ncbi:hypothetical protein BDV37DRAFT_257340 [Aspergillus pseudonomiae]|uniref:Fungal-type protein kinase domain-containing protein n=1 Tax=Aspergillus pseudonomiae TaxID=1506151 RepID=A0A5N7D2A1_9EURO|nr:uncharacterized protein BDV37DRAFT_257340 [Aspergillus pseudonomiae]KAE8400504.1 hypothetical protein BDV37DRAFT_257340 [Aspergillus pseudonomiae]